MEQFTPQIKTFPTIFDTIDATLRLTYLAKPTTNHTLHLATSGTSDSALMLTMCALQMFVLLLLLLLSWRLRQPESMFRKTWKEVVDKDMDDFHMKMSDAMDHSK